MSERVVWTGCYDQSWKGLIVPEAFAHPAKASRGLLVRIFVELGLRGWVQRDDLVVDPFGGIGTTAIEGASRGFRVVCCELEPKFVGLAERNFAMHRETWATFGLPVPEVRQGDSRRLRAVLSGADAVVSSPPYAEIASGAGGLNTKPANHGQQGGRSAVSPSQDTDQRYGLSAGQLARLPSGPVDAVVGSPPFADSDTQPTKMGAGKPTRTDGDSGGRNKGDYIYGASKGQLGTLPNSRVADALVASPPYEGSKGSPSLGDQTKDNWGREGTDIVARRGLSADYGASVGQLGHTEGETFWSAAKQIVKESYAILKPGGVAVWIVKAFVRNKTLVDFPGDWRILCEHVGFETVLEAHASLVHEERKSHLFDGEVVKRRERKSFFRRLAEKKGSPRIDHEVVWFTRKPA